MASAPTPGGPGTSSNEEAVDMARKIMVVKIDGKTYRLALGNVPVMEKVIVQEATGLSFERWLGDGKNIGEASVLIFCWLAVRALGNKMLTLEEFAKGWTPLVEAESMEIRLVDADDETLPGDAPES